MRYWLFVILTLLVTVGISFSTYRSALLLRQWRPTFNPLLVPIENLVRLVLLIALIALGRVSALPPEQLGWVWPNHFWNELSLALVVGLGLVITVRTTTSWVVQRWGPQAYSPLVAQLVRPRSGAEWLALIPAMLLVVGVEELLFRSLLIGGLEPIVPAVVLVVIWSALFGFLHLPQGPWGMVGAGMISLLLCWIFLVRGTIFTPIVIHLVVNLGQLWLGLPSELEGSNETEELT